MTEKPGQTVQRLRVAIPAFECEPGCHACCGPVAASVWEIKRLAPVNPALRAERSNHLDCVHLGSDGCTVYAERPLLCRLFGTVPRLACPKGRRPVIWLNPEVEQQVGQYFRNAPHALL